MTETLFAELPHGITLHCRVAGPKGAPVLMFSAVLTGRPRNSRALAFFE